MALDILIVDDERDIRDLVAGVLSDEGYDCRTAGDSEAALAALERKFEDVIKQCSSVKFKKKDQLKTFKLEMTKVKKKLTRVIAFLHVSSLLLVSIKICKQSFEHIRRDVLVVGSPWNTNLKDEGERTVLHCNVGMCYPYSVKYRQVLFAFYAVPPMSHFASLAHSLYQILILTCRFGAYVTNSP